MRLWVSDMSLRRGSADPGRRERIGVFVMLQPAYPLIALSAHRARSDGRMSQRTDLLMGIGVPVKSLRRNRENRELIAQEWR